MMPKIERGLIGREEGFEPSTIGLEVRRYTVAMHIPRISEISQAYYPRLTEKEIKTFSGLIARLPYTSDSSPTEVVIGGE